MRALSSTAAFTLGGLSGGCVMGDDTGEATCGNPEVVIGTGDLTWIDLHEGDGATMVHGPQGGWHMLAGVRAQGFPPEVDIHYTIEDVVSGVTVSDNHYGVLLGGYDDAACTGSYLGMYGYLWVDELAEGDLDTPPELLVGHDLRIRLVVEALDGPEGEASIVVVGEPDPKDVLE